MAKQTINLGSVANDGTGDDLRVGGDKINDNFDELYTAVDGKQPLDSDLTAIAALTTTAFGRGFLDLADAEAARTKIAVTPYFANRSWSSATNTVFGINSTSYVNANTTLGCYIDLDTFPATHFRILLRGQATEVAQTVTAQLSDGSLNAVHTGGNDLIITNTDGGHTTGWLSRDDGLTGLRYYFLGLKGSNVTVDLTIRTCEVHWKIA